MRWVPQKPPSQRSWLAAFTIVAIPIIVVIVSVLVLAWQLLGASTAP